MKTTFCVSLCVGVIWIFGGAVVGAEAAQEDPLQAIEQANAKFGKAFASGDPSAVAAMYTENGRLLPPNSKVVEGRKAIEEFWKGVMATGIKTVVLKSVEVESFGETIVEQGTAILYGERQNVLDTGKYLVVWKRVGGEWKLHRDCWNSSEPVTMP